MITYQIIYHCTVGAMVIYIEIPPVYAIQSQVNLSTNKFPQMASLKPRSEAR